MPNSSKKTAKASSAKAETKRELSRTSEVFCFFLLILPICLFFSYFPVIHLGDNASMNFELSIPLIWLIVFDIFGIVVLIRQHLLGESFGWLASHWYLLLFPAFLTLSLAWSLNPLRGLLTVGIIWLLFLAIFLFLSLKKVLNFPPNFAQRFWRIFFGTSLLICAWCWIQCLMDLSGESQSRTLLCDGCLSTVFGFPRPDGFAIEPQFMGNLLLAPTIFAGWFALTSATHRRRYYLIFFVFLITLFLTLSRGAIYAFLLAFFLLTILQLIRTKKAKTLLGWVIIVLAFVVTLGAQGFMATIGPTSDDFATAVAKSVHQLSLGVIDLRDEAKQIDVDGANATAKITSAKTFSFFDSAKAAQNRSIAAATSDGSVSDISETSKITNTPEASETTKASGASDTAPVFDGYIAGSTDTRLRLTDSALAIWRQSPRNVLLGVGLGGAGQALYDNNLSPAPKEIVQNQYASLLLETGLIGVLLATFTVIVLCRLLFKNPLSTPLVALLIAYAVTLCFFSGLANALQIYLMPPLIALVATIPSSKFAGPHHRSPHSRMHHHALLSHTKAKTR